MRFTPRVLYTHTRVNLITLMAFKVFNEIQIPLLKPHTSLERSTPNNPHRRLLENENESAAGDRHGILYRGDHGDHADVGKIRPQRRVLKNRVVIRTPSRWESAGGAPF